MTETGFRVFDQVMGEMDTSVEDRIRMHSDGLVAKKVFDSGAGLPYSRIIRCAKRLSDVGLAVSCN